MAQAELKVAFDGRLVAGGQMDARLVGATLLAVSDLVRDVKNTDPTLRDLSMPDVRVASFEEGSFDIQFVLEGLGDAWEQIRRVATGEDVTAVVNIAGVVTVVVGAIRLFGKRRVASQAVDESGETVIVEFEDGELSKATMPADVFTAFMSSHVRNSARRMIEPVERPGIEALTLSSGREVEPVTVTKADAPNFHAEEPEMPEDTTVRRTARVQPVSINFSRESWSVSEGAGTFPVKVEDKAFLRQLDDGRATIGKTDVFEVGLRTEQYTDADGRLKVRHAIERVISHEHGAVQGELDFGGEDGSESA